MSQPTLPEPVTAEGRAGLAALLAHAGRALVALDFDGTLSPIVDDPMSSRLAPGGVEALRDLAAVVARVVIVTGRPAATVVELGGLADVPGVLVEGLYGAEQWCDGTLHQPDPPPELDRVRAELPAVLAGSGDPGVWVEDKRLSLVIHTRRAADPEAALTALAGPAHALAERHGMHVEPGRFVLEIRSSREDKGATLRRVAGRVDPAAVMFCGDDVGDLPAFDAVGELRRGGVPGLTVCSASAEAPAVAAHADLVLDGPLQVVRFLADLAAHASA